MYQQALHNDLWNHHYWIFSQFWHIAWVGPHCCILQAEHAAHDLLALGAELTTDLIESWVGNNSVFLWGEEWKEKGICWLIHCSADTPFNSWSGVKQLLCLTSYGKLNLSLDYYCKSRDTPTASETKASNVGGKTFPDFHKRWVRLKLYTLLEWADWTNESNCTGRY